MSRSGFRGVLCLAVAVCAVALIDPCVEAASNAGWFGRGNYTDHSTLDVIPAVLASAGLALLYVVLRARALAGRRTAFRRLGGSLRGLASQPILPLLPAIFSAQLVVLYGLETIEQILVAGHPLGGTIWLGAPVLVALALHAGAGALIAYVLVRALDALTRITVSVALFIYAGVARASRASSLGAEPARGRRATGCGNPLASRSGKRAPPFVRA